MAARRPIISTILVLLLTLGGAATANWSETFDGGAFDLGTWLFTSYPELTGTFEATIQDGPGDEGHLSLDETSAADGGGSQFGIGIGNPDDVFTDVRVGATFNVRGDASRNYHGLAARIDYFLDDGSISGYPGIVASCYVMVIHYEDGPANMRIELVKAVNLSDEIMETWQPEVPVPGVDHARSHYVELDVVGSDPVYITGSIYEYKGGPLLARTPTFVDTSANDPWERAGIHDDVFASGRSGIFSMNENSVPVGYHCTFDNAFSVSDGPAAVVPSPADGATNVSVDVELSWIEAGFATSRELWLGVPGAMEKVEPGPTGTSYRPASLEFGQTYRWRIDQIGPGGTAEGYTWEFTTAPCLAVDDFESYANDAEIATTWVHNIPGDYDYVFLDTGTVHQGANAMRFEYQNQYEPFFTQATQTFAAAQDWTARETRSLSLDFRGEDDNVEQSLYVEVEDTSGAKAKVLHPLPHAVQAERWQSWDIDLAEFSNAGVDLAAVTKLTIGAGNGTASGQPDKDVDTIYVDNVRLCPARCVNPEGLDLRGDVNGDCKVDFEDLAVLAAGWLNDGSSVLP